MKTDNIRVGMVLELKNEVFTGCNHADGAPFTSPYVIVTELKYRDGYKVPYIKNARGDAFKPRDFVAALDFTPEGAE